MACQTHPDRDSVAACVTCGQELCEECKRMGADGKSYCAKDAPAVAAPPPTATPSAPPAPPAGAPPPPAGAEPPPTPILAALAYPVWIIAIVIIASDMKRNKFMAYHGWNALFWGIGWFVVSIAMRIVSAALHSLPGVGSALHLVSGSLLYVLYLVGSIVFAIRAANQQDVNIPIISDFARKQAGV